MAQPHKGDRRLIQSTRAPLPLAEAAAQAAERLGVHRSDYLLHALCVVLDMPEYDPLTHLLDSDAQEQMQMTA
jgi:hypothetical protein